MPPVDLARLRPVQPYAEPQNARLIVGICQGCQRDYVDMRQHRFALDRAEYCHAVMFREMQIQDNDARLWLKAPGSLFLNEAERCFPISQDVQLELLGLLSQRIPQQKDIAVVVFDHEDVDILDSIRQMSSRSVRADVTHLLDAVLIMLVTEANTMS